MIDLLQERGWIVLTGALAAGSCGLLGCYLILRRMALLGDAVSHAVLPGIVLAFLFSGSRATVPMLLGAGALGLFSTFVIESLDRVGRVQRDAAIGITFTTLFSIGVILVTLYSRNIDLDQECVLYGEILYIGFDRVSFLGASVPRATLVLGGVFAADLAFILLLWKELKICSFDPAMARALGIRATLVHYLLMAMVSLTVVAAFESVGAILVVAMLIVPGATAYLLTDRLAPMLGLSLVVSVLSSLLGTALARSLADVSTAGAMTVAAGGLFAAALIFSPRHGVAVRAWARLFLAARIALENLLGELQRAREDGEGAAALGPIAARLGWKGGLARLVLFVARRRGLVRGGTDALALTEAGEAAALRVRGAHRAWQEELQRLGYDRVHAAASADRLEHGPAPGEVS